MINQDKLTKEHILRRHDSSYIFIYSVLCTLYIAPLLTKTKTKHFIYVLILLKARICCACVKSIVICS